MGGKNNQLKKQVQDIIKKYRQKVKLPPLTNLEKRTLEHFIEKNRNSEDENIIKFCEFILFVYSKNKYYKTKHKMRNETRKVIISVITEQYLNGMMYGLTPRQESAIKEELKLYNDVDSNKFLKMIYDKYRDIDGGNSR